MPTCPECRSESNSGRCLNCRRNDYHRREGALVGTCRECEVVRVLARNGVCRACLKAAGLRECSGACGEVKLQLLEFQEHQGVCRACRREAKKLDRARGVRRR